MIRISNFFASLFLLSHLSLAQAQEVTLLTSVTDSLGNIQSNSLADDDQLAWPSAVATPVVIEFGDQVQFSAQATGPDGDTLEYKFSVQGAGGSFAVRQDWSASNSWTWNVTEADFGTSITVLVSVRDEDDLYLFGEFSGDDYTYLEYRVDDPLAADQPILTKVVDSLGNVQTNSLGSNITLGWPSNVPDPVRVSVGDRIGFTATASAAGSGQLEYRFAVQPPGGSLEIFRDWSTNPSATWTVGRESFGPDAFVFIAVRNNDGLNVQGEFNGDDYTDVSYFVNDPNASKPAEIVKVVDNLGNAQTNSFANEEGGSWPASVGSNPQVNDGDTITFNVTARDSDSRNLEYKFAIQRVGGSFETRRDWSSSNSWSWQVNREDFGRTLTVLVAVRDDDNRPLLGSFGGDDYTYLEYRVGSVDITGAIQIIL